MFPMPGLQYNEIREKRIIIYDDEPCEVVESHVARTQQRKPQNQVKLRSLVSGKTFAATFHVSDTADEVEMGKKEIKFLYHNRGEYWFCESNNPKNRFKLNSSLIGETGRFLKENTNIIALVWDNEEDDALKAGGIGRIIKIILPIKMEFKVKEAPPSVRGDTAKGGNKTVILENGTAISAPMFLNEGDIIRVNTETGEYAERV